MRWIFVACLLLTLLLALLPVSSAGQGGSLKHILAFFALSISAAAAFPRVRIESIFVGLLGLGALIEVFQALLPTGRSAEWEDFAIDAATTLIGLIGARRLLPALIDKQDAQADS